MRHAVAFQFVGVDHPWLALQFDQKPLEEAFGCFRVTSVLSQGIGNHVVLINVTPEIVLNALDPDGKRYGDSTLRHRRAA